MRCDRPGVYALGGRIRSGNESGVGYVGSAYSNLKTALKDWVGSYKQFKFRYSASPRDAFEMECLLFHAFSPGKNHFHPAAPAASGWKCPKCKAGD